mmetsp:Transcript_41252/g.87777  ORF Transcript_41252/g.87777 Transcript_41252/m.87777 type:complete len:333 (+) Transcript_41252:486-1484(+)
MLELLHLAFAVAPPAAAAFPLAVDVHLVAAAGPLLPPRGTGGRGRPLPLRGLSRSAPHHVLVAAGALPRELSFRLVQRLVALGPPHVRALAPRAAKVPELHRLAPRLGVRLDQDIRTLDVPVNHTARVQELRRVEQLDHDLANFLLGELLAHVEEVAAVRVLQHEVQVHAVRHQLAADQLPLASWRRHQKKILQLHHVGMPEAPLDVDLADDVLRVGFVHEDVSDFLHRHELVRLRVAREAHHAEAALAYHANQLVPGAHFPEGSVHYVGSLALVLGTDHGALGLLLHGCRCLSRNATRDEGRLPLLLLRVKGRAPFDSDSAKERIVLPRGL